MCTATLVMTCSITVAVLSVTLLLVDLVIREKALLEVTAYMYFSAWALFRIKLLRSMSPRIKKVLFLSASFFRHSEKSSITSVASSLKDVCI